MNMRIWKLTIVIVIVVAGGIAALAADVPPVRPPANSQAAPGAPVKSVRASFEECLTQCSEASADCIQECSGKGPGCKTTCGKTYKECQAQCRTTAKSTAVSEPTPHSAAEAAENECLRLDTAKLCRTDKACRICKDPCSKEFVACLPKESVCQNRICPR